MSELTYGPPTTAPVAVAITPSRRSKRIGRWIGGAAAVVIAVALAGLLANERSTSSSLRDDVTAAQNARLEMSTELDATTATLDDTRAALGEANTALRESQAALEAQTARAAAAEARGERLDRDITAKQTALDALTTENEQLIADRDAAAASAAVDAAALAEVETAVRNVYIAVFTHGDDAVPQDLAVCYVNDLVEFAGIPKLLEWDTIVAAGGELPPDGERAYGHAYFECG